MKTFFTGKKLLLGLVLSLSSFIPLVRSANAIAVAPQNLAQLQKYRSDFVRSITSGSMSATLDYYATDVRLMPEYQKTILGKTNAAAYHEAFFRRFAVVRYQRNDREVTDLGSQIVEIGLFEFALTLKSTGESRALAGKYLDLWEKQPDGRLLLVSEAWNYNHDVPFSDELRFPEVPAVHMALQARLPLTNDIRFELAALDKLLESVVQQHDAKTWSRFYADDGMFLYSHHPIYQGRKALDEFLEQHARDLPVFEKLDIRCDRIDDLGAYVIQYASHVANWKNGDSSGVSTGKNIRIWRREANGSLRYFRTIAMYD